nr:hypothetical protein [Kibdelosporangium sp. MJ126-NF4]CTQ90392.1 hypothetical protein [Kibdelosporangium sp. MJ126-NF4]
MRPFDLVTGASAGHFRPVVAPIARRSAIFAPTCSLLPVTHE